MPKGYTCDQTNVVLYNELIDLHTECAGVSGDDPIDDSNIEAFRDCTIITSGGIFIGFSGRFK